MKNPISSIMVFFFTLTVSLYAQEKKVKIIQILDCNLFETETGSLVRLANVKTPSTSDTNAISHEVSKQIISWLDKKILNKQVILQYSFPSSEMPSKSIPVQMFYQESLFLNKNHVNLLFLQKGFGKFRMESDTSFYKELEGAEGIARKQNIGLWNSLSINQKKSSKKFILGYSKGMENFGESFREFLLTIEFKKGIAGLKTDLGIIRNYGFLCGGQSKKYFLDYYLNSRFILEYKYLELNAGFIALVSKSNEGFYGDPSGGLKFGILDKFYISCQYFDESLLYPFIYGIGFKTGKPNFHFWVGYSEDLHFKEKSFTLKNEILLSKRIVVQGLWVSDTKKEQNGFRIGLGYYKN